MDVVFFTLCDYAKNNNGKLTIVDTFDAIRAEKMPWRAYFGFAFKLKKSPEDVDDCVLSLKIISKDKPDTLVFDTSAKFVTDRKNGIISIAGNLKGLVFEGSGDYCFNIFLNEKEIYSHIFKVELLSAD